MQGACVFISGHTGKTRHSVFALILGLATAAGLAASVESASAQFIQQFEKNTQPFLSIDEVRVGGLKQAVDDAPGEGGPALNLEVLFGRVPSSHYENHILDFFLTPRPYIGANIAFGKTDQFYWGAAWDFKIMDRLYFEADFGGAAHDGPLSELQRASYGCTVNFKEAANLGYALSEHWRVLAEVDHMSNAGLCGTNRGLTNAGVRLGYKW